MKYRIHKGRAPTDARYGSRRWREVRKRILARDLFTCWMPGCPWPANVCDHVSPVVPGMPDSEFYDETNLRASCRAHNLAKGTADRMARINAGEESAPPDGPKQRSSYGGSRRPLARRRDATEVAAVVDDVAPTEVRYHLHARPTGDLFLTGNMSVKPRWDGLGCPPECSLPRPVETAR